MAEILLKNAVKKYNNGKVLAVDDLTLECHDREFVAILGPSGAGKTSTLKMIAGIERLDEGQIFIDGKDVTDLPPQVRNVSMVFEGYALYPHLTVRENLAFPLRAPTRSKKLSNEEIREKVEEWAKIVGLDALLDRKTNQLSGGQRQRVSLARALIRSPEPNVILMDEPIAHLDAKLRNSMRAELKRLQKDLGVTIIYVTHDYTEAMAMADRIYVINNGCLMQQGTAKEIYESPANEFVASTVGEPPMNFISGEIKRCTNGLQFAFGESVLQLRDMDIDTEWADLGIRPSEIEIYHEDPGCDCLMGTILEILPTGAKQIMEINVSNRMVLAKVLRDISYQKGQTVYLVPMRDKLRLFHPQTKEILRAAEEG